MIFKNPEVEKIAKERLLIIENVCKCHKYYINIPWLGIKWFAYCKYCGCYHQSKVRCIDCHCPKHYWKAE